MLVVELSLKEMGPWGMGGSAQSTRRHTVVLFQCACPVLFLKGEGWFEYPSAQPAIIIFTVIEAPVLPKNQKPQCAGAGLNNEKGVLGSFLEHINKEPS